MHLRAGLAVAVLVASCARPPAPHRAFYHWRTTLQLSPVETRALGELAIDRLYLRVFDVDWEERTGAPALIAPLSGDGTALPPSIEVTPVVYVRARVLRHLTATTDLAAEIWRAVGSSMARLGHPHELQIDCDWAAGDRARYFGLLASLAEWAGPTGVALSATIRLHQVKYRERTGVPPVARGMLMFYNMGPVDADPETHAIFDAGRATAYLSRVADYPLPLDVALPIWSWTVHVRDGRVAGLLQDTDPDELPGRPWLHRSGDGRYEVTEASFLNGVLLRQGDYLVGEQTTAADVEEAAALIAPRLAGGRERRTIALYHLSERNLARHETSHLARVLARFR